MLKTILILIGAAVVAALATKALASWSGFALDPAVIGGVVGALTVLLFQATGPKRR